MKLLLQVQTVIWSKQTSKHISGLLTEYYLKDYTLQDNSWDKDHYHQ